MPRIEEMYAFVYEDSGPEDEGVMEVQTDMGWMILAGLDISRMDSLRPIAEATARVLGKPIKLLRFTTREDVEVIQG